jgi:hypothetical protein
VPATLSTAEIEGFHQDGYVVVRGAFARADALAMQDEWWGELEAAYGIGRDPATWRPILGDLKRPKLSPLEATIATARVRGVVEDLLGPGAWRPPRDWGRALVTFPQAGPWDVPTGLWHWDSPHIGRPVSALFVVSFVGSVGPGGGGTLILSGSPRLLARQEAELTPAQRGSDAATRRDIFCRSHPWLRALTGKAASPADRIAAFMAAETEIEGVAVRVVELSGEPGDMVVCHPTIAHCIAPNTGTEPRFMRIKQQLKVAPV